MTWRVGPFDKGTLQVLRTKLCLPGKVGEIFKARLRFDRESRRLKRRLSRGPETRTHMGNLAGLTKTLAGMGSQKPSQAAFRGPRFSEHRPARFPTHMDGAQGMTAREVVKQGPQHVYPYQSSSTSPRSGNSATIFSLPPTASM